MHYLRLLALTAGLEPMSCAIPWCWDAQSCRRPKPSGDAGRGYNAGSRGVGSWRSMTWRLDDWWQRCWYYSQLGLSSAMLHPGGAAAVLVAGWRRYQRSLGAVTSYHLSAGPYLLCPITLSGARTSLLQLLRGAIGLPARPLLASPPASTTVRVGEGVGVGAGAGAGASRPVSQRCSGGSILHQRSLVPLRPEHPERARQQRIPPILAVAQLYRRKPAHALSLPSFQTAFTA
ncbi:hypothetical protein DOTSEDRAFT_35754 [Dothistroma septosporum NZE10]|uniref:Secreted protein n=1 Tax=Dothistroma septosporum (strain NZE10 / CBS 128990) TaxID=675120 RepID=M2WNA8_DOTSN|nr:hypothetical protein DOTSEDRAFT_35754 [Dothistroma septosporum NZE10]